jgi:hypothetical protein
VPTIRTKFFATANADPLSRHVGGIGTAIFFPPFNPASIAAKLPCLTVAPCWLKFYATIRAGLLRALPVPILLLLFFAVVSDAAAIAAKSPQPSTLAGLLNVLAAFRAGIYRNGVIPFGIVVFDAAVPATVFLPRMVTSRFE